MQRPEQIKLKPGEVEHWLGEQLLVAFFNARTGKRRTEDEHKFEVNLFENIEMLKDDILNRCYHPSPGTAFVVDDPVKREIFAAPFRDRVVHHFLYNMVMDWWDRRMCYTSAACRVKKGTLFAVRQLERQIKSITNNFTMEAYAIKLDIRGYFMSLPRKKLFERVCWGLERQFPEKGEIYKICRYLWKQVIFDDPTIGVRRRGKLSDWDDLPANKTLFGQEVGRGIVIGNLSSQLLSNIYLDLLDRFVTLELGYKYYGRYVDDFYYLVTPEQYGQALQDIGAIQKFLEELELELHPKKRYVQPVTHGVPYVGTVVYPGCTVPGKRIKKNFYDAAWKFSQNRATKETINSYLGHMKHINGKQLTKRVFEKNGWDFEFF